MLNFGRSALLLGNFEGQLNSIREALEGFGIHSKHVPDLAAALREQRSMPRSVVVCDLPSFSDSLQALERLRAVQPDSAVIVLAPPAGWRWVDMLEHGAFDVISSPCHVADLAWMADHALRATRQGYCAHAV